MRAKRIVRWLMVVAAVAMLGQLAGTAAPAAADPVQPLVAGLTRVEDFNGYDGVTPKQVTVTCPAGTRVYSAGGRILKGEGTAVLDDLIPDAGLTSVTVKAYETAADDEWGMIGYAMCGNGVLNLQRVSIESANNSLSPKTVTPTCPGATKLYGIGAEVNNGVGNVVIDDLTPLADLSGLTVTAYENGAFGGNWSITGYAICGNPVATMTRVTVSNPVPLAAPNAVSPKTAIASPCPAGTQVHGGGGTITGGLGNVSLDDLLPSLVSMHVTGFAIGGFAGNWRVTSYAICAS
jgi:hypothetical protein